MRAAGVMAEWPQSQSSQATCHTYRNSIATLDRFTYRLCLELSVVNARSFASQEPDELGRSSNFTCETASGKGNLFGASDPNIDWLAEG
jgi:hypothetical protein